MTNNTDGSSALAVPPEASLFGKMARVMGIVNRVPKTGTNTFHRYKYATADDVADTIRGAMAEVNLALIVRMGEVKQDTIEYESSNKKTVTIRTTITFDFIFACGDTGAVISSPWTAQVDDNSDKAVNKCATSAEKYFLMKTFIVSAGDEPDADADKHTPDDASKVIPMPAAKWFQADNGRALHEMSERAFTAGLIAERNSKGVALMEAMIAPRTWDDFADRKAAGDEIKNIAEKRRAAAPTTPIAIPTPAQVASITGIKPADEHIVTAPDSPFANAPLTNEQLHQAGLEVAETLKNAAPLSGDAGKSGVSNNAPTSAAGRALNSYYGTPDDERRAAATNGEMDADAARAFEKEMAE